MQVKLKVLLAERDKKSTEKLIELESKNDELEREVEELSRII